MNEEEMKKLIEQIESELNGDPEHDADIWNEWGERYRGQPDAEPLLHEIGKRLFALMLSEDEDMPQEIFNDMVETADEDFAEACDLIAEKQYEYALGKLLVLTAVIKAYPLSDDAVWTDFERYLDSLVYEDYYEEEIGEKEVRRHPMHPGKILYTCGSLLIEMDRAEEALEPLELLLTFDPVSPKYLFELSEAYKRTGQIQEAYETSLWAISCASNWQELARGYRDLAYCMIESGEYDDALMLYMLSLRFHSSNQAEAEIAWIRKKKGVVMGEYSDEAIRQRCEELQIPVGISEIVQQNIDFLNMINQTDGEE